MKNFIKKESNSLFDIFVNSSLIIILTIFLLNILELEKNMNVQIFNNDFFYGFLYSFITVISFFLINIRAFYKILIKLDKEINNKISIFLPLKFTIFINLFITILIKIKEYHNNFFNDHSMAESDVKLYLYMFIFLYTIFTLFFSTKILIRLIGIHERKYILN